MIAFIQHYTSSFSFFFHFSTCIFFWGHLNWNLRVVIMFAANFWLIFWLKILYSERTVHLQWSVFLFTVRSLKSKKIAFQIDGKKWHFLLWPMSKLVSFKCSDLSVELFRFAVNVVDVAELAPYEIVPIDDDSFLCPLRLPNEVLLLLRHYGKLRFAGVYNFIPAYIYLSWVLSDSLWLVESSLIPIVHCVLNVIITKTCLWNNFKDNFLHWVSHARYSACDIRQQLQLWCVWQHNY